MNIILIMMILKNKQIKEKNNIRIKIIEKNKFKKKMMKDFYINIV